MAKATADKPTPAAKDTWLIAHSKDFTDINDGKKTYKPGDDVSHLDADTIKNLSKAGFVYKA